MKTKLTNTLIEKLELREKYYDVADTELPGLVVRIQPSGLKVFYLRYRLPSGKRRSFRIGEAAALPVAEARNAGRLHWADAAKGVDPMDLKHQPKGHTLESFLDVYEGEAALSWHFESVKRVRRCFKSLLSTPLKEITMAPILQYRNRRRNEKLKTSTINRDIAALRGVLSRAVAGGFITKNPCSGIKSFGEDSGKKPRYLKPDELTRLYKALDDREEEKRLERERYNIWLRERSMPEILDLRTVAFTDHLKPMTLLALNTGLRRGEIFNLHWSDCDFVSQTPMLTVRGDGAKSGKTRHIPMSNAVLDSLTKWRVQAKGDAFVFASPVTGERMDNIKKSWTEVTKKAKLTDFKFHDCRHHFASTLVQRGCDLNVVRELLGHADLKLTMRYAHLAPHNAAAAVALLDLPENVIPMKKTSE